MFKIEENKLFELLYDLSSKIKIYAPIKDGVEVNFNTVNEKSKIDFDCVKTKLSPKNIFFPKTQDLMNFKLEKNHIDIEEVKTKREPIITIGIKNCDYKSINVFDAVFLNDLPDISYQNIRENILFITQKCLKFEKSCFCKNFNISPFDDYGDISMLKDNKTYYFNPITPKGMLFINENISYFEECNNINLEDIFELSNSIFNSLPYNNLNLNNFKPENTLKVFNMENLWKELSINCIGCGTCTFCCPTCYCYDIKDFKTNSGAIRYRCYDSCMFSDFTLTAGGNPRKEQWQRFRQRFMHKLFYHPQSYNEFGCVGCGRCVKHCPNSINIVNVITKIGENLNE